MRISIDDKDDASKQKPADGEYDFYDRPEPKSEKEKLSGMTGSEKRTYFLNYYAGKTMLIAVAAAVIIFLIVHFTTKKDTALNVVAVNALKDDNGSDIDGYFRDFLEDNGINPDKNQILCQSSLYINATSTDSIDNTMLDNITALFLGGNVDVFMADEGFYGSMAGTGFIADISQYLPQECLEQYADDIVYSTNYNTNEKFASGIELHRNKWTIEYGLYDEDVVVGIADCSSDKELTAALIKDILEY